MQRWANQGVIIKRATKQETELRVAHAAELVADGQVYSSIPCRHKIWNVK